MCGSNFNLIYRPAFGEYSFVIPRLLATQNLRLDTNHGVDELLTTLGHMPYAVMLMAKVGRRSRSSARDLLEEWKRAGTEMISHLGSPEDNMNRSISLSVNRNFVQQNSDAVLLLATLSLLPAGTTRENLRWWAPNVKSVSSAIAALSDAGLLLMNSEGSASPSTSLFLLPVVQSFMAVTHQISESVRRSIQSGCCQYITNHVYMDNGALISYNNDAMTAEDTNIRSILLVSFPENPLIPPRRVMEALLQFCGYCNIVRPSIEIAVHALAIARSLGDQGLIAQALYTSGVTLGTMDRTELAEQSLAESYQILKQFTLPELRRYTAECGLHLAAARMSISEPIPPIIDFLEELLSTFGDVLYDYQRARILRQLGDCLSYDGRTTQALENLSAALGIFMRSGYLGSAAISLDRMSIAYRMSSQLEDALRASVEACSAAEWSWINPISHATIHFNYGCCLFRLSRYTEALQIFKTSLSTFEYMGNLLRSAYCLEAFGIIHASQGESHEAVEVLKDAIDKYIELGEISVEGRRGIGRCRDNSDRIKRREESEEENTLLDMSIFMCQVYN